MPINESRIAKLATLGLSTYEARVYLALLDLGSAPARRLAEVSGVPQTRLYETCRALHQRGLVEETLKKPKEYQAVPISRFLASVAKDYERKARGLEEEREAWEEEFRLTGDVAPTSPGTFLTYHGRRRVLARSRAMFASARARILVRASPQTFARIRSLLAEAADPQSLDIRVVAHITEEALPLAEAVADTAQVRHSLEPSPISFVTVDGREGMLYHWGSRPVEGQEGDVALWTDDPELVAGFEQSILDTWTLSVPLAERAREIRTGAPPRFTKMLQGNYTGRQVVDMLVPKVKREATLIVSEGGLRRLSQSESFLGLITHARLRILAPVTKKNLEEAHVLARNAEVRHLPFWFGQNHVLLDNELAFVTTYIHEGRTLETTDLLNAVHSNEPGIVEAERQLFEGLWSIGIPLHQRAAELAHADEFLRTTRAVEDTRAWVQEALTSAQDEVCFMTTERGLARVQVYDYGPAMSRGARFRLVAPITEANEGLAQQMAQQWEVRHHPGIHQGQFIIDRKQVITAYFSKDAERLEDTEIFCVSTNATPAVEMALTLFEAVWDEAQPLEARLRGEPPERPFDVEARA